MRRALLPFAEELARRVGAESLYPIGEDAGKFLAFETGVRAAALSGASVDDGTPGSHRPGPVVLVQAEESLLSLASSLADALRVSPLGVVWGRASAEIVARAGLKPAFSGRIPGEGTAVQLVEGASLPLREVAGLPASPGFRVIALLAAFNEADVIVPTIRSLAAQGVESYVIDNWSTDGTYDLCEPLVGEGIVGLERFPPEGPVATYQWSRLLRRKEELATSLAADWFIHHDVDEVRRSPWPGVGLRDALAAVDRAGFNAVDHTCIDFVPIDDAYRPGTDLESHFLYFRFGTRPGHFMRVNTWKRRAAGVDLAPSGGHDAVFAGRRVFPYKFLLKHYPIRSQDHGERKVLRERVSRWDAEERARGWHHHYDHCQPGDRFVADPGSLRLFDETSFCDEFLFARLTGIGIPRTT